MKIMSFHGTRIFPASDPWNTRIDGEQVDPNSQAILERIGLTDRLHPDFGANWNGGPFGIPYIVVSSSTPRSAVVFDYDDESDHVGYPFTASTPIEGGPSAGGDRHAIMVDRDSCTLYELYDAHHSPEGSTAGSGAVWDLRSNALRPATWTSASHR